MGSPQRFHLGAVGIQYRGDTDTVFNHLSAGKSVSMVWRGQGTESKGITGVSGVNLFLYNSVSLQRLRSKRGSANPPELAPQTRFLISPSWLYVSV